MGSTGMSVMHPETNQIQAAYLARAAHGILEIVNGHLEHLACLFRERGLPVECHFECLPESTYGQQTQLIV